MTVSINGVGVGTIRERATWCYPVYHVFDSVGSYLMKIRGPACHFSCCKGRGAPLKQYYIVKVHKTCWMNTVNETH